MGLARRVAIIGIGMTKFGALGDVTTRELFTEAAYKAMLDAGVTHKDIDGVFVGNLSSDVFEHQMHLAPLLPDYLALDNIPATRTEAACASGGLALRSAIMSVASGMYDVVLAGGVEKMTNLPTSKVTEALAMCSDDIYEANLGVTFPGVFAMMARRHMHEYGTTPEMMAAVAVKAHDNAMLNPYAQFHKQITIDKALESPMVADPLHLYDCSPITDGAAALIVTTVEKAKEFEGQPVEVIASAQTSDTMALHDRPEFTGFRSTRIAADKAFKMAGIERKDIDVVEVHDCFTIAEIMALEDIGFFKKGEAGPAILDGQTRRDGDLPVNPSGGLKAKGHPIGATGISQVFSIVEQLRGVAGSLQIADAEIGLTQNLGGSGGTQVLHIFKAL